MDDKFKLTADDEKRIKYMQTSSQIYRYLANRDQMKFKVGDILVKMKRISRRGDDQVKWEPEAVSDRSQVPKKYLYVSEDDMGIGYVKQIKSDGSGLCEAVSSVAELDFHWCRYEVDPSFIDHAILIGDEEDYKPGEDFKQSRKERNKIHAQNRKIAIRANSEADSFAFLDKLVVGQKFWMGYDLYTATQKECTVVSVSKETVSTTDYKYRHPKPGLPEVIEVKISYVTKMYGGSANSYTLMSNSIRGSVFYLEKPVMYDDDQKTI